MPAICFGSGNDLVNGGAARGDRWPRIIAPSAITSRTTNISPTWDFTGIVADAQLLHAVGLDLANSTAWPNWSADSEFRGTRDRSAAERGAAPAAVPPPAEPAPGADKGERG